MSPNAPSPPPAPQPAIPPGIKQRLLDRVADADHSHLSIALDDRGWQPWLDGVEIKPLYEKEGVLSYLLRLAPGATLPAHSHPIDEECLVLDGLLRVGSHIELGPGGYHLAHQGALHARISTPTGATIFLRGAVPQACHVLG